VEVAEVAITRAGDHGLARSWWRDEHTEVMVAQIVHGVLLLAGQRGGERELPRLAGLPFVGDLEQLGDGIRADEVHGRIREPGLEDGYLALMQHRQSTFDADGHRGARR